MCDRSADGLCWIDWSAARTAFDTGESDRASSMEIGVLDLAICLGSDRFRFRSMGPGNAQVIATAAAAAAGRVRATATRSDRDRRELPAGPASSINRTGGLS